MARGVSWSVDSRTIMAEPDNVAMDTGHTMSRHSASMCGLAICETQASSSKPLLSLRTSTVKR
jgi:hypothetical protein